MNDFFNSLGNTLRDSLCDLDLSIHDKIKDTAIDNFIHELKDYLFKSDSIYKLSKLPKDTLLDINEIESNYIQCYLNHEEYNIPKEMVYKPDLIGLVNDGWISLQLKNDGLYHVIKFDKSTGKPINNN